MGRSFPGSFLDSYLADVQNFLSVCNVYFPELIFVLFLQCELLFDSRNCSVMVSGAKTFSLPFCCMFPLP